MIEKAKVLEIHDKWDLIADTERDFKMGWKQSEVTMRRRKPFIDL